MANKGFPVTLLVKDPPANAGDRRDLSLTPGSGRSPGGGHGNPLQYFCLENPMDKGSLAGYSPQSHTESDMTEMTQHIYKEPNSNIYQDILDISKRKTDNPNKKSAKHLNRHFKKEDIQKDDSSGKCVLKTPMRYRCTANGVAKSKTAVNAKGWQECGSAGTLIHCWWTDYYSALGNGSVFQG